MLSPSASHTFLLIGEDANSYRGKTWDSTKHNLDLIFERDGVAYGIEVKNTLGYPDVSEFITKIKLSRHIGVKPVFAVRALPKTWAYALVQAGGYAMIMGHQFYPWTHKDIADQIREALGLPVDTPRRIEQGTMQRFENWIVSPPGVVEGDPVKVERFLAKIEAAFVRKRESEPEQFGELEV